jgi:RHS repeat-associated core domain
MPPGSGGPVYYPSGQEPFRNSDMGPLGVVLSSGDFQITVTDLEIPGRGMPFRLSRTYRSKRDGEKSLLGHNWQLSYDEYLTPGSWTFSGSSCTALEWRMGNGYSDVWVEECGAGGAGWVSFVGFFGKILPLGAGHGYKIRYSDGTVKTFDHEGQNAQGQTIWMLNRIEDRNGNAITIQHAGRGISTITDTLGRTISFAYEPYPYDWRITSVTDFNGRMVDYNYDANGDLREVWSPPVTTTATGGIDTTFPSGKSTKYEYLGTSPSSCTNDSFKHNLKTIIDAKNHPFLTNTYYDSSDSSCGIQGNNVVDTVANQVYKGGTLTYSYARVNMSPTANANDVTTEVTVTDRNGNIQVHGFNTQGNPVNITYRMNRGDGHPLRSFGTSPSVPEPDYVESNTYVIDSHGEQPMLVSQHTESGGFNVDSDGDLDQYSAGMTEELEYYDQQSTLANPDVFRKGNVIKVTRKPDLHRGGGQPELVIDYEYEWLYNQPISISDPHPIGTLPAHVTRLTYDFQEGSYADLMSGPDPDSLLDLWWSNNEIQSLMTLVGSPTLEDFNGDGYQNNGNLIRISEGAAKDFDGNPTAPGPNDQIETYIAYNSYGLPTIRRDAEYNETVLKYFAENDPDGDGSNLTPGRSGAPDEAGGGYLKEKVLDASPTMPKPTGVPPTTRESGQNPTVNGIHLYFNYDRVGNIKNTTDGRGIRTDYIVNELNQIVEITRADSDSIGEPVAAAHLSYKEQFQYDLNDNLIKHRIERRDSFDQIIPGTRQWITKTIAFDDWDRKISESVLMQDSPEVWLTTQYVYDSNGNLCKTVYPLGNAELRFYDERDLLFKVVKKSAVSNDLTLPVLPDIDPAVDSVTQYDYDASGNVIRVTDPEGHISLNGYDGYGRKVVTFDAAYQKGTYSYDERGKVSEQVFYGKVDGPTETPSGPPGSAYPELSRQTFNYDEVGRLRRADSRYFKYLPTPVNIGDGLSTRRAKFDRLGRVIKTIDDNGHSTEVRYDGLGRKLKILADLADVAMVEAGHPNDRNEVDFEYDKNGNVTQFTEKEYGTDRTGGSSRYLSLQEHVTQFAYDSMNRQVKSILVGRTIPAPDQSVGWVSLITEAAYDSRGNRIQLTGPGPAPTGTDTDSVGNRSKLFYDRLNRLIRKEEGYLSNGHSDSTPGSGSPNTLINASNPDGIITTTYSYDDDSRLTSLKDDNNRITTFTYDNLNRQTGITYPDSTYRVVAYDKDSLNTSWIRSSNTGYTLSGTIQHDWLHRPKQVNVSYASAPQFMGTTSQSFEYDGLGRLTRALDDVTPSIGSEVILTYNSLGNVLSDRQKWHDDSSGVNLTGDKAVTSEYDGMGLRSSVAYPDDDRTVNYIRDGLNRPERIVDAYTGTTKYDFVGTSRVLNRIYPNGTKLTMLTSTIDETGLGYDVARRVEDYSNTAAVGPAPGLAEFMYGYDNAGNRKFERRMHESPGSEQGEAFVYDPVDRVVTRKEGTLNASNDVGSPTLTQAYTLDGLGNWKTHKKNSSTYNQTINSLNQYTVFNGPAGQKMLQYDFKGNVINEYSGSGQQQYTFDFLNRLTYLVDYNDNITVYRYDALGRRISKNMQGGLFVHYIYDGDRMIQEWEGNGQQPSVSYMYGPGTDEILTRRKWYTPSSHQDIFYHTNALGSVTAVTSDTGVLLERYKYDAYGQVTFMNASFLPITISALNNDILFTGRYYDMESKLYYYRARMYHPYFGRFLQRDPLGEGASLNLYNYVSNNPVNFTDPTGMYRAGRMDANYQRHLFGSAPSSSGGMGSSKWKMHYGGETWVDYRSAQFRNYQDAAERDDQIVSGMRDLVVWHAAMNISSQTGSGDDGGEEEPPPPVERVEVWAAALDWIFGEDLIEQLIGDKYGAGWREAFTEDKKYAPHSQFKVPIGTANALKNLRSILPADAWKNGMHAWHAASNAYLAKKYGLVGAPFILLGGLVHELEPGSFSAEQRDQGSLDHFLDSYTDMEANYFGVLVGIFDPTDNAVNHAMQWGNYIPGPGYLGAAEGGRHYEGDPTADWGYYP